MDLVAPEIERLASELPEKFHLVEFQAIHAEINVRINNIELNFRLLMLGVAGVWGWLFSNVLFISLDRQRVLLLIPTVFTILFGLIIERQIAHIYRQDSYLALIEDRYGLHHFGWEQYCADLGKRSPWAMHRITIVFLAFLQSSIIVVVSLADLGTAISYIFNRAAGIFH